MNLNKKLFFRVAKKDVSCFCSDVKEVKMFLSRELDYQLSAIEKKAVDYLMSALLPFDKPKKKRSRFLLVINKDGVLGEFSENEELPADWQKLAIVFSDAFTQKSNPVARFDLNPGPDAITLDVSRFRSDEALPIRVAENAWSQQATALFDPNVPYVMSDVDKMKGENTSDMAHEDLFVLKIGENLFRVHNESDVMFVLSQVLEGRPDKGWSHILPIIFRHLHDFPRGKVFHKPINLHVDNNRYFYAGDQGNVGIRRLRRCGVFYPEYFCGGIGPLVRISSASLEDVLFDFYLFRPDKEGNIPEQKKKSHIIQFD